MKQLISSNLKRQTTCMLHKTLIRPTLTCGSEGWPLTKNDGNMLRIFERRTLRIIYGPGDDNSICGTRYNNDLYTLCNEKDLVKMMRIGTLRWLGHFFRMQDLGPCRRVTLLKPEGTRRVVKLKLRWLEWLEQEEEEEGGGGGEEEEGVGGGG